MYYQLQITNYTLYMHMHIKCRETIKIAKIFKITIELFFLQNGFKLFYCNFKNLNILNMHLLLHLE